MVLVAVTLVDVSVNVVVVIPTVEFAVVVVIPVFSVSLFSFVISCFNNILSTPSK